MSCHPGVWHLLDAVCGPAWARPCLVSAWLASGPGPCPAPAWSRLGPSSGQGSGPGSCPALPQLGSGKLSRGILFWFGRQECAAHRKLLFVSSSCVIQIIKTDVFWETSPKTISLRTNNPSTLWHGRPSKTYCKCNVQSSGRTTLLHFGLVDLVKHIVKVMLRAQDEQIYHTLAWPTFKNTL